MALSFKDLPAEVPACPEKPQSYVDIAVTATAPDFAGYYRAKQYHEPDFDAVLDRAMSAGVGKVVLTGMHLADVEFNLLTAKQRPDLCRMTIGVHPYYATEPEQDTTYLNQLFAIVEKLLREQTSLLVGYGELGLDYDHLEKASKEVQLQVFERQLDLVAQHKLDLPLFLHCRSAFDDFVRIIEPYMPRLPQRGVVHSFVGSKSQMQILVHMGLDISVNGFAFRDQESLEMVKAIPLQRLQLETDAPWGLIPDSTEVAKRYLIKARPLPQSKKRDKFEKGFMVKGRNESCTIERVAYVVAGLKGCTVEAVAAAALRNSTRMFNLS